jgi:hypothetical protein
LSNDDDAPVVYSEPFIILENTLICAAAEKPLYLTSEWICKNISVTGYVDLIPVSNPVEGIYCGSIPVDFSSRTIRYPETFQIDKQNNDYNIVMDEINEYDELMEVRCSNDSSLVNANKINHLPNNILNHSQTFYCNVFFFYCLFVYYYCVVIFIHFFNLYICI